MANFKKNSRYTNGNTDLNADGVEFLVLRKALKLEPNNGDIFVSINKELINRPDLISFKAYGTPNLWWVIYEYNNIQDPLFGMKIGQLIRIPSLTRVQDAISKLNKV
jgi:hypothetical protein